MVSSVKRLKYNLKTDNLKSSKSSKSYISKRSRGLTSRKNRNVIGQSGGARGEVLYSPFDFEDLRFKLEKKTNGDPKLKETLESELGKRSQRPSAPKPNTSESEGSTNEEWSHKNITLYVKITKKIEGFLKVSLGFGLGPLDNIQSPDIIAGDTNITVNKLFSEKSEKKELLNYLKTSQDKDKLAKVDLTKYIESALTNIFSCEYTVVMSGALAGKVRKGFGLQNPQFFKSSDDDSHTLLDINDDGEITGVAERDGTIFAYKKNKPGEGYKTILVVHCSGDGPAGEPTAIAKSTQGPVLTEDAQKKTDDVYPYPELKKNEEYYDYLFYQSGEPAKDSFNNCEGTGMISNDYDRLVKSQLPMPEKIEYEYDPTKGKLKYKGSELRNVLFTLQTPIQEITMIPPVSESGVAVPINTRPSEASKIFFDHSIVRVNVKLMGIPENRQIHVLNFGSAQGMSGKAFVKNWSKNANIANISISQALDKAVFQTFLDVMNKTKNDNVLFKLIFDGRNDFSSSYPPNENLSPLGSLYLNQLVQSNTKFNDKGAFFKNLMGGKSKYKIPDGFNQTLTESWANMCAIEDFNRYRESPFNPDFTEGKEVDPKDFFKKFSKCFADAFPKYSQFCGGFEVDPQGEYDPMKYYTYVQSLVDKNHIILGTEMPSSFNLPTLDNHYSFSKTKTTYLKRSNLQSRGGFRKKKKSNTLKYFKKNKKQSNKRKINNSKKAI